MKPRIPTVNDILRKWRSKTSHVGKFTILLFRRNAWILLHVLAHCVLLFALSDHGYILWHVAKTLTRMRLSFRVSKRLMKHVIGQIAKFSGELPSAQPSGFVGKDFCCVRTFDDRVVFMEALWQRASFRATVHLRSRGDLQGHALCRNINTICKAGDSTTTRSRRSHNR